MSQEDLGNVENIEVEALSDEELDSVAGGLADGTNVASCTCCAYTAITVSDQES